MRKPSSLIYSVRLRTRLNISIWGKLTLKLIFLNTYVSSQMLLSVFLCIDILCTWMYCRWRVWGRNEDVGMSDSQFTPVKQYVQACCMWIQFSLHSVINAGWFQGGCSGKNKSDTWINNVSGEVGVLLWEEAWLLQEATHQVRETETKLQRIRNTSLPPPYAYYTLIQDLYILKMLLPHSLIHYLLYRLSYMSIN